MHPAPATVGVGAALGLLLANVAPTAPTALAEGIYLLAAVLGGSGLTAFFRWIRDRNTAGPQGEQYSATAIKAAGEAARMMLDERRREAEELGRQREKLSELLVRRNEQVSELEERVRERDGELAHSHTERAQLRSELDAAINQATRLARQLEERTREIENLRVEMAAAGAVAKEAEGRKGGQGS